MKNIAIIGAGISGMSVAYLLSQKGYKPTIYSKAFSPNITSNRAAAFWFPYHIRNDKRGVDWCRTSYEYYKDFATRPETGISIQKLVKVLRNGVEEEEPIWIDFMPQNSYRMLPHAELPAGFARVCEAAVPLIETQIFLPWLQQQLIQKDIQFIQQEITGLNELAAQYDIVINSSALGSIKLCDDKNLVPVRGQVALLATGAMNTIYLDNESLLYVVPRKDAIIVGGTYEENVDEEITEPATIERLLKNAYNALPELKQQAIIGSWAGLRPYRKEVRVEREINSNIIHNYGHGGSGFTLAFGCAESVLKMVEAF
ncbi:MAG: FAD-dependent oxidoreductase [Ferruginibacter sp.]